MQLTLLTATVITLSNVRALRRAKQGYVSPPHRGPHAADCDAQCFSTPTHLCVPQHRRPFPPSSDKQAHTHTHTPSLRQTRISFFLSGGVTVPMTDRARLIKGYIALLFHSQVLRGLNAVSGVITDLGKSINCINRVWRTITAKDKIFLFYFLFVQHVGVSL